MPDPNTVMENKWLRVLAPLVNDPNLLHFNRRSVSAGMCVGVFAAFIPLPVQMFVAIALSLAARGNIAVAAAATWISNPFTYGPLYYVCYLIGVFFLGEPLGPNGQPLVFELSTLLENIWTIGKPLLFGCAITGIILGLLSYISVRYIWRLHILSHWKARRATRKSRKNIT